MSPNARKLANRLLRTLAKLVGSKLRDAETGEVLGKAILIPWRGKIHVVGYGHEKPLVVQFLPRGRVSYWRQEIGFGSHPEPDFPNLEEEQAGAAEQDDGEP